VSMLRLVVAALLVLPVGAVTIGAGAVATAFAWLRNTGALLLGALLRELFDESGS
jgi:hypothetical protein